MNRRADQLSDATIREMRTVTITGRLIGVIPTATATTIWVQMPHDSVVEIHSEES